MDRRTAIVLQELQNTRLSSLARDLKPPASDELILELSNLYDAARFPSREQEQDIVERTIEIGLLSAGAARVLDGCVGIFARLGYFPSIGALERQYPSWRPRLPLRLQAEAAGRIASLSPHGDLAAPYTPFQADLHSAFIKEAAASISAPTSSGKSFVLGRLIFDFAATNSLNVAYLVPTRALIAEVSGRIRSYLRECGSRNPIRTSPVPLPGSGKPSGHVYVLTQERLLGLLGSEPTRLHLDVLLIDEAHEVAQKSARGILLESAIEAARRRFPKMRVLMASPGIPNPEYLLGITQLPALDGVGHVDRRSPVVHNYVELRCTPSETQVILHNRGVPSTIGMLPIGPSPDEPLAAWGALQIHQRGHTTLVYCRSPTEAEFQADWLDKQLGFRSPSDPEIEKLAVFIQRDVHPGHPLSDMLRKGLATHYGKMPPTVKSRIEQLAAAGKLDIVCCTSTLLSGVNLPCRNMVMYEPRKGKGNPGEPLTEAEIRNLAGRAGRVDCDLLGNVWVMSTPATPPRMPTDQLPPIETAFSKGMRDGARAVLDLSNPDVKDRTKNDFASAFTARAFDLSRRGIRLSDIAAGAEDKEAVQEAEASLVKMQERLSVPQDLLANHHAVAPSIAQNLLEAMLKIPNKSLQKWVPLPHRISPEAYDELDEKSVKVAEKYEKCKLHFAKVIPYLAEAFKDGHYMWPKELAAAREQADGPGWVDKPAWRLATISSHWINGVPLGLLLRNAVSLASATKGGAAQLVDGKPTPGLVRDVVRRTMETIEDDIRFRFAQQWRLIQDLLTYIYTKIRPEPKTLEGMVDLHLRLEFGTINEEALSIMGLGFSRAAAREIRKAMRRAPVEIQPDAANVIEWVLSQSKSELEAWKMPPEVWLEVCVVAGRDSAEVSWE